MADILKSSDSTIYQTKVVYDAQTSLADVWMVSVYGSARVILEPEEAQEFEQAAKAKGLTIEAF